MNARNLKCRLSTIALAAAALLSMTNAHAWGNIAAANASFDAQFNARLSAMQQQNNAGMQQLWQRHLQVNGPRMQAQYRQLVASGQARGMTYQQFAYWDLMSAAGTNPQGALDAQRRQFAGNQAANATVQSGHASYNQGYWNNQARTGAALNRYSEAARGNAGYVDQYGARLSLPYSIPQGQTVTVNGNTYAQDAQGNYYRHEGQNYWSRVNATR